MHRRDLEARSRDVERLREESVRLSCKIAQQDEENASLLRLCARMQGGGEGGATSPIPIPGVDGYAQAVAPEEVAPAARQPDRLLVSMPRWAAGQDVRNVRLSL